MQFSQLNEFDLPDSVYVQDDTIVIKAEVKELAQAWK